MKSFVGCWRIAFSIAIAWSFAPTAALAQQQAANLKNPVAMTSHRKTGHTFVVEQGKDRIIRWDGQELKPIFESLSTSELKLARIVGVTFRDGNRLSLLGFSDKEEQSPRIATLKVDVDKPAAFDSAMTSDLLIGEAVAINAIASTDLAIYFSTTESTDQGETTEHKLWRLATGKATLGKPRVIRKLEGKAQAIAITPQGHVVTAIQQDSTTSLEFFHAGTGQQLLVVPTNLESVSSLAYSPKSKLLYAAGSKADRPGVYRMDVAFDGSKQASRATEITVLDDIGAILISDKRSVALLRGEQDGRLVTIDLK